jgi:DNA-binding NtrC family response regulator
MPWQDLSEDRAAARSGPPAPLPAEARALIPRQNRSSFHGMLGNSPRMHAVFELIGQVARTTATVLIEGETGTGKEQVARAIHRASREGTGPLVAVQCAAVPEALLESELFGHERGAFSGAVARRKGRFERADGGTLFLDEVGDLPATMQAKLLRVLQERRFERVGSTESIEVDVRVIAATNRPLHRLVAKGKFREDLYYRLNVVKIDVPPLRDRPEDIPLLAAHFAQKHARPGEPARALAPEAVEDLLAHCWPGNVRELENAIERACLHAEGDWIRPEHLALEVRRVPRARRHLAVDLSRPLSEVVAEARAAVERQYLGQALRRCGGHVGRCATLCGLSRRAVTDKLAAHRLDRTRFQEG